MNPSGIIRRLILIGAAVVLFPLSGCASVYHAEPIEAWIVDAESGKPLEDVIVVANWELKGGFEGGIPVGQLQIYEAVTDQNGRFQFPGWGPRVAVRGKLESASPQMLFFKSGYKSLRLVNRYSRNMDTSKSIWNKKTIKLERFNGTPAEYAEHLSSLSSTLESVGFGVGEYSGDYCGWRSFPRMLRAIDGQYVEFRRAGISSGSVVSHLRIVDSHLKAAGCGSIDDLVCSECHGRLVNCNSHIRSIMRHELEPRSDDGRTSYAGVAFALACCAGGRCETRASHHDA